MAAKLNVRVLQHNDRTLEFDLTSDDPLFTLAGKTLEFYVKRYRSDPDEKAVVKLTSATNAEIEVADPDSLTLRVKLLSIHLANAGCHFYRLDIRENESRVTAMYGAFEIEDV